MGQGGLKLWLKVCVSRLCLQGWAQGLAEGLYLKAVPARCGSRVCLGKAVLVWFGRLCLRASSPQDPQHPQEFTKEEDPSMHELLEAGLIDQPLAGLRGGADRFACGLLQLLRLLLLRRRQRLRGGLGLLGLLGLLGRLLHLLLLGRARGCARARCVF